MLQLACNAMIRDPRQKDRWLPVEPLIETVRALGFGAIDFQLDRGFRSRDPAYLESIREMCATHDLPIGFLGIGGGFVGVGRDQDGYVAGVPLEKEERTRRIREAKAAIDAARLLGAPLIRLFGGGIPEASVGRDRLWGEMIGAFQELCDYAGEHGVGVGLHNHPPALAPTGDDILRIISEVDRKNLAFILDTGQWYGSPGTNPAGRTISGVDHYRFIEQTIAHAAYIRAKIYKIDRGVEEWLDYRRIARIVRQADYQGVISIVYEDRGNSCAYPEAWRLGAAHLRECFGLGTGMRRPGGI